MKTHFTPTEHGDLSVTGKNKIEITLKHKQPFEVFVAFKDECDPIPCNPNHFDELEWEMHFKDNKFVLIIKWHVSSSRDIFWAVKY